MGGVLMWLIADSTKGFFLEYWIMPEKKCVVSLKSDLPLEVLESVMMILRAMKVVPR